MNFETTTSPRRSLTLLGLALCTFFLLLNNAVAQTRPRPQVRTTAPASYRYAYEHGYRAGYDDGNVRGKSDFIEARPRDAQNSEAYRRANRTYQDQMGKLAEYQDGYQIGFELGYDDGYYGRSANAAIPANLGRIVTATNAAANNAPAPANTAVNRPRTNDLPPPSETRTRDERPIDEQRPRNDRASSTRDTLRIPDGTQMKVRLTSPISTKTNKEGDQFTATVLDPAGYADAQLTGHIAKLNKSGKMKGKTELALVFDTIELRDGRRGRFAAQVERVYESETVRTVDEEGNVESGSRTTDTAVRTGGGAALGAIIGAVAGGGKGAAIGAAIGAGVGAGSVIYQGSKDLELEPGTEMLIRSASPAQTRN